MVEGKKIFLTKTELEFIIAKADNVDSDDRNWDKKIYKLAEKCSKVLKEVE